MGRVAGENSDSEFRMQETGEFGQAGRSFNKRSIMAAKNRFSTLRNWLSLRIGQSKIPEGED
jgi:hypothetical protein